MKCPNCDKAANIKIGQKLYCTNCGDPIPTGKAAVKATPVAAPAKAALRPAATATPRPIQPVVAPVAPGSVMSDLVRPRQQPTPVATEVPKSAEAFHARLKPARGGVLDLRGTTASAPAAKPIAKHVTVPAANLHRPAKVTTEPTTELASRRHRLQSRLAESASVQRSHHIQRFHQPQTDAKTVPPTKTVMPPAAVAHHEHLQRLLEATATKRPSRPGRASLATAAVALAVMSGYIWLHNYPRMAVSNADAKAGFAASLPNYLPTSYSLSGPIAYAPGSVSFTFASPSARTALKITQQPTTWDARSLLDNYVSAKTAAYTSVQDQGLTIYFYNGNNLAWINHGIWYTMEGTTGLSRDQLLKIAYSF